MFETKTRSVVKSIIWRVLATINGFVVAFIYLGEIKQSMKIAIVANITGLILYFLHERWWNIVGWGRK